MQFSKDQNISLLLKETNYLGKPELNNMFNRETGLFSKIYEHLVEEQEKVNLQQVPAI